MGDVVDLNKFRKKRDTRAKPSKASENRVRYGRKKTEHKGAERKLKADERSLDDKRLEQDDPA